MECSQTLRRTRKNGLFLEGDILETVRKQYQKWHQNAQEKQFELENHVQIFRGTQILSNKTKLFGTRTTIHSRLFERDIVTQKVYVALQDSLHRRMKKYEEMRPKKTKYNKNSVDKNVFQKNGAPQ